MVEADFPATVYEPGVLFLRVTLFRRALQALAGMKQLAIQVNNDGMFLRSGWRRPPPAPVSRPAREPRIPPWPPPITPVPAPDAAGR